MDRLNTLQCLTALALVLIASTAAAQGGQRADQFTVRLTMVPISPAERSTVTGGGAATARLVGRSLRVQGTFSGLQGQATTGALHLGPVTAVRGGAIAALEVTPSSSGEITGDVELSADQVEALREGRIYIQVHSEAAPEGNLWGWLLPTARR
jgi:hypothetical protein